MTLFTQITDDIECITINSVIFCVQLLFCLFVFCSRAKTVKVVLLVIRYISCIIQFKSDLFSYSYTVVLNSGISTAAVTYYSTLVVLNTHLLFSHYYNTSNNNSV